MTEQVVIPIINCSFVNVYHSTNTKNKTLIAAVSLGSKYFLNGSFFRDFFKKLVLNCLVWNKVYNEKI